MNQSILFPDLQRWDASGQCVTFPAQQGGALIECAITVEALSQLSGQPIEGEASALAIFKQYRFDIEELAEERIEDEDFNQFGQVEIVSG